MFISYHLHNAWVRVTGMQGRNQASAFSHCRHPWLLLLPAHNAGFGVILPQLLLRSARCCTASTGDAPHKQYMH